MAQKKTTKKPTAKRTTAKRATAPKRSSAIKGNTNLKTRPKWLNWKVITLLIIVVAAVGGYYYVKQSEASSYFTFVRNAGQMQGGQFVRKSNGTTSRKLSSPSQSAHTIVSTREFNQIKSICAVVTNGHQRLSSSVVLWQQIPGQKTQRVISGSNTRIGGGQTQYVCGFTNKHLAGGFQRRDSGVGVKSAGVMVGPITVHSIRGVK